MKKNSRFSPLFIICFLTAFVFTNTNIGLPVSANEDMTVLINQDFDNYSDIGEIKGSEWKSVHLGENPVDNARNSLIIDAGKTAQNILPNTVDNFEVISYKMYTISAGSRLMQIYDSNNKRSVLIQIRSGDNKIGINNKYTGSTAWDYSKWHTVTVVFDNDNLKYDVYLDNVLQMANAEAAILDSNIQGVNIKDIRTQTGSAKVYIDNAKILRFTNKEDAAMFAEAASLINDTSEYVLDTSIGNYSETRYEMVKSEAVKYLNSEITTLEFKEYYQDFLTKKFDDTEEEIYLNHIDLSNISAKLYTDENVEYALTGKLVDNKGNEYAGDISYEIVNGKDGVSIDGNLLKIQKGLEGKVSLKCSSGDLYRYIDIEFCGSNTIELTDAYGINKKVYIKGNVKRSGEDEIFINIENTTERISDSVMLSGENENGDFEIEVTLSKDDGDFNTCDIDVYASGDNLREINKIKEIQFVYYGQDADTAVLSDFNNCVPDDVVYFGKKHRVYIGVNIGMIESNREWYEKIIAFHKPFGAIDALKNTSKELKLLVDFKNIGRNNAEEVLTGNMDYLISSGFDETTYNTLSETQKDNFLRDVLDIVMTEPDGITDVSKDLCQKLNAALPDSDDSQDGYTPSGGGGGGGKSQDNNAYKPTPIIPDDNTKDTGENPEIADKIDSNVEQFADVEKNFWAADAILFMRQSGIAAGDGRNFYPNAEVTRGETVKLLVLAFKLGDVSNENGTEGEWWLPYARIAKETGVMKGNENGDFAGSNTLIRQDMAVLISRILKYKDINLYEKNDYKVFNDENEISDYAKEAVDLLYRYDVMRGVGEKMFDPRGVVTRAQIAQTIYNILSK